MTKAIEDDAETIARQHATNKVGALLGSCSVDYGPRGLPSIAFSFATADGDDEITVWVDTDTMTVEQDDWE